MSCEAQTLGQLVEFFKYRPDLIPVTLQSSNDVMVWEEIFHFFFGEYPVDNILRTTQANWRRGSTDPRWDELLPKSKLAAMQAMDTFVKNARSTVILVHPIKQAA